MIAAAPVTQQVYSAENLLVLEEQAEAKTEGSPVVAATLAAVKVAQKAEADAKFAEKAEAQLFVSALVHAWLDVTNRAPTTTTTTTTTAHWGER